MVRVPTAARDPRTLVLAVTALALGVGIDWGLPGTDSWATDSISPRSAGLGAIAETYLPGHFHTYPPLHMAIVTVLAVPWILLAAARAGTSVDALGAELIKPLYMTGIEAGARAVAVAMAVGIVWSTMRLWERLGGRRAGVLAGVAVAANAPLVYYGHTGNLDVPYLFWTAAALVAIDGVLSGEASEARAALLSTAAVLTKDQAAAVLLVPLGIVAVVRALGVGLATPAEAKRARRRTLVAAVAALAAYALLSGAATNPTGFARRLRFLFGPASRTWAGYAPGRAGTALLVRDAIAATPRFTSWLVAAAAAAGLAIVVARTEPIARKVRALMPAAAALSFTLFFTLGARRTEDRFLLPQSLFLAPYAAMAFGAAWAWWPKARGAWIVSGVVALLPAVLGVASIDATLLADARYAAEDFLRGLPSGTRVEIYGGPIFLPRIPSSVVAVRPGVEPIADRQLIAGVSELVDPQMDPRPRAPGAIVLATELSTVAATEPPPSHLPYGLAQYQDARSHALFRGLRDGSLGYSRALRASCRLPWPLSCRDIHNATGGEVWIYVPTSVVRP